mmetsp:Transcript_125435/g.222283  ORF Transcript_125435/g.222283 Transcript_125435/m.222283 type:complete len:282 (-) Transcript_125435:93-938(-)
MRERLLVFLLACGDLASRRHMGYGYQVDDADDPTCCDDSQDPVASVRQVAGRQLLLQANSQLREAALDEHLSGATESSPSCGWVVHYNRWEPTFDKGEFEHNDALGGAHCLDACCRDPSCLGLTLESSEKYQCYKYSSLPDGLDTLKGKPLGDAKWLLSKTPTWSVFVKTVVNPGGDSRHTWQPEVAGRRAAAEKANATALSRSRGLWEATASHTVLHRPVLAQLWGIGSLSAVILIVLYICVSDKRRTATQLLYSIGGPSHDPERKSLLAEMKSLKLTAP